MPTRQHNPATASVSSVQAPPARKRSELQVQELLSRLRHLESVVDGMKAQAQDRDSTFPRTNSVNMSPSNELNSRAEGEVVSSDPNTINSYHDLSHKLSRSFGSLHVCEGGTLYTSNGFWSALHGEVISLSAP